MSPGPRTDATLLPAHRRQARRPLAPRRWRSSPCLPASSSHVCPPAPDCPFDVFFGLEDRVREGHWFRVASTRSSNETGPRSREPSRYRPRRRRRFPPSQLLGRAAHPDAQAAGHPRVRLVRPVLTMGGPPSGPSGKVLAEETGAWHPRMWPRSPHSWAPYPGPSAGWILPEVRDRAPEYLPTAAAPARTARSQPAGL